MLTRRDFAEVQRKFFGAWHRGEIERALAEIESALEGGTPEMRAECLLCRGMIRQHLGASAAAREDWTEALPDAPEGTYLRFRLEQSIGEALEGEGLPGEALGWYTRALRTCSDGDEFSGHRALAAYLRQNDGSIDPGDEALVASVIEKSWRVLEFPGVPDLADLRSAAADLAARFAHRVEEMTRLTESAGAETASEHPGNIWGP